MENWVESPPTGIRPPTPIGQSQAETAASIAATGARPASPGLFVRMTWAVHEEKITIRASVRKSATIRDG